MKFQYINVLLSEQENEYQEVLDKDKDKKIIFKEKDPKQPFPPDTIKSFEKEINKRAKDLETEWKSAKELVDSIFDEFEVEKPGIGHPTRWEQYKELLTVAVKDLYEARGFTE